MSNPGEPFRISPEYPISGGPSLLQQDLIGYADPRVPLLNLSTVKTRMDSLQHFLSQSVNTNTLISKNQMDLVSSEIASAVHQIIVNGAALLSCAQKAYYPCPTPILNPTPEPKPEFGDYDEGESEIIEFDAVELLSEHLHFCEICGKGFKRDANLRMHMRAHGNQYKTPEALAKKSENKWECSCGNSFSRKDKLFRHVSLFEGHMPAVVEEEKDRKLKGVVAMEEDEEKQEELMEREGCLEDGFFDGLLDGFGSFENYCLQDVLGPSHGGL
ncbi:hypothetical protein CRYUN_Cryun15aG0093500 [Craigia yunnanensis]